MDNFNDFDFLSSKPELRSKHAFDVWRNPSVFKRHPSRQAYTLSKQVIVSDARINQRAALDIVEANEEHFKPSSWLQSSQIVPYSLNKKNRWNLTTEDLIKNKNPCHSEVTFSSVKALVHWDGGDFAHPLANSYTTLRIDGKIVSRQARSQRNPAALQSLVAQRKSSKKPERSGRQEAGIKPQWPMPKVEVIYLITQPHPSEEFSRMKANKESEKYNKRVGKKMSRNRRFRAVHDDFDCDLEYLYDDHDDEV